MDSPYESVLQCQCTTLPFTTRIVYILAPMKLPSEATVAWANLCHGNVAVIYGMDWDNCLTPWPAPNSEKGCPPFKGLASEFLHQLKSQVFPTIERAIGFTKEPERNLVGISLSGLFALWAWIYDPGYFQNIASVSGSLWYPEFVDWVQSAQLAPSSGRAYFLLGEQERTSKNPLYNTVEAATRQILNILQSASIKANFNWNPGGHLAPIEPRLESAFKHLFT